MLRVTQGPRQLHRGVIRIAPSIVLPEREQPWSHALVGLLFEQFISHTPTAVDADPAPALRRDQLVDRIVGFNPSANPTFLLRFPEERLEEYLSHLQIASEPRGSRWVRSASTPAIVWHESPTD